MDGLEMVRAKRPIAEPNPGFILQLKAQESVIFGKMSNVPLFLSKERQKKEEEKKEESKLQDDGKDDGKDDKEVQENQPDLNQNNQEQISPQGGEQESQ